MELSKFLTRLNSMLMPTASVSQRRSSRRGELSLKILVSPTSVVSLVLTLFLAKVGQASKPRTLLLPHICRSSIVLDTLAWFLHCVRMEWYSHTIKPVSTRFKECTFLMENIWIARVSDWQMTVRPSLSLEMGILWLRNRISAKIHMQIWKSLPRKVSVSPMTLNHCPSFLRSIIAREIPFHTLDTCIMALILCSLPPDSVNGDLHSLLEQLTTFWSSHKGMEQSPSTTCLTRDAGICRELLQIWSRFRPMCQNT
mmetsp:Transcript_6520/g.24485  ORF Transcript_6520/g.24485 Transcript_6520/m.24485 type:complete len:255 (+) Transcript_6520:588-1352(+)